jgi:hypothetical protein
MQQGLQLGVHLRSYLKCTYFTDDELTVGAEEYQNEPVQIN